MAPRLLHEDCVASKLVQSHNVGDYLPILGHSRMGHSISEVAMKFRFSRTTISRVYHEYRESGNTSNLRHRRGLKKVSQERDQRRLTRIIKRDRMQPFFSLQQILMLGHQQVSPCEPFNKTSSI
ncbi:uncharacterized protein TNCV_3767791 [Trichonephila clavipes]|nr:uncharacterized protein TNCV_3767791 [Trichonephila clavipes]